MSLCWVSDPSLDDDDDDVTVVASDDTECHVRDTAEMAAGCDTVPGAHISGRDHVHSLHPTPDGHQL